MVDAHFKAAGNHEWTPELKAKNLGFFPPGSMWFAPWFHDPANAEDVADIEMHIRELEHGGRSSHFLSIHYWLTWARVRPPIVVVCPGGMHWCVDQKSNNGTGWTVYGDAPVITCSPSIWVAQGQGPPSEYHGWLENGVFRSA